MTEIMEDRSQSVALALRVKASGGLQALGKGGAVRVAGMVKDSLNAGTDIETTRDDAKVEVVKADGTVAVRVLTTAARTIKAADLHNIVGAYTPLATVLDWMTMGAESVAKVVDAHMGKDAKVLNDAFVAEYATFLKVKAEKKAAKTWEQGAPKVVLSDMLEQVTDLTQRNDWDGEALAKFDALKKALETLEEAISGE